MVCCVPVWAGTVAAPAMPPPAASRPPVNTHAAASRPAIFPVRGRFIVVPFPSAPGPLAAGATDVPAGGSLAGARRLPRDGPDQNVPQVNNSGRGRCAGAAIAQICRGRFTGRGSGAVPRPRRWSARGCAATGSGQPTVRVAHAELIEPPGEACAGTPGAVPSSVRDRSACVAAGRHAPRSPSRRARGFGGSVGRPVGVGTSADHSGSSWISRGTGSTVAHLQPVKQPRPGRPSTVPTACRRPRRHRAHVPMTCQEL
jgi:hypothetical protein